MKKKEPEFDPADMGFEAPPPDVPEDDDFAQIVSAPAENTSMMRLDFGAVQAIQNLPPRDETRFITRMEGEASRAGESFYYSWPVKLKGGKTSTVTGASIGLAMAMARQFGKCLVKAEIVDESERDFILAGSFIDLEGGVLVQRQFKQRKEMPRSSRMDPERALDIAFQIGQSKVIRNVILSAMPAWLVDRCITLAQRSEAKQIEQEGVEVVRDKIERFLGRYGITREHLDHYFGKPYDDLSVDQVAELRSFCRSIAEGQLRPSELLRILNEQIIDDATKEGEADGASGTSGSDTEASGD